MTQSTNDSTDRSVFKIRLSTAEGTPEVHIEVHLLGQEIETFHAPDLATLLEALNYNGAFVYARYLAMRAFRAVLRHYKNNIWVPRGDDEYQQLIQNEEYSSVRKEVWDLIRISCVQERNLMIAALDVISKSTEEHNSGS
jgi:hypothetical protein